MREFIELTNCAIWPRVALGHTFSNVLGTIGMAVPSLGTLSLSNRGSFTLPDPRGFAKVMSFGTPFLSSGEMGVARGAKNAAVLWGSLLSITATYEMGNMPTGRLSSS